jgi:D-alanyl-D-alanine carboxypeptidase/D-alanyl-D-alanine-endopeptidase (penicillin-binding protein 4)
VLSPRRVPELVTAGVADERLARDLGAVVAEAPATSCLRVDLDGRVLAAAATEVPLVPASNQKLLTAAALLSVLPPDARLATTVAAAAPVVDGVVEGDLFVVGGGDPTLITPGYREALIAPEDRALVDYAAVADAVVGAGVREVRGGVVGDGSRHEGGTTVPSWLDRYLGVDVGALGALSVNDGREGFTETPDEPAGERPPGDPALLAAATLTTLLEQRGVAVGGPPATGTAPPGAVAVAALPSPTVAELVRELLAFSDNEAAEVLVRELGLWGGGAGTTEAGLGQVVGVLGEAGIDLEGVVPVDGSGLDTGNRLTCEAIGGVLDAFADEPAFADGLAVAGVSGTLRSRFVGTPAEGRVRAKTGSLNAVSALSGYVEAPDGRELTFAFVVNFAAATPMDVGIALQDRVVEVLARYPDRPDRDEVVPREPEAP